MKKTLIYSVFFAILAFALITCDDDSGGLSLDYGDPTVVTSVTLSPSPMNIAVGDDDQNITATVLPTTATVRTVTWKVEPASGIITLSGSGSSRTVHAVKEGTAVITVTTDDGGITATCTVTVGEMPDIIGLIISPASLPNLEVGDDYPFKATPDPKEAASGVIWSISPTSVATVNSAGVVTGVSVGTATLTATSIADDTISKTAAVTVVPKGSGGSTTTPTGPNDVKGIRLYCEDFNAGGDIKLVNTTFGGGTNALNDGKTVLTAFDIGEVAEGYSRKIRIEIDPVQNAQSYKVNWREVTSGIASISPTSTSSQTQEISVTGGSGKSGSTAVFEGVSDLFKDVKVYFSVEVVDYITPTNFGVVIGLPGVITAAWLDADFDTNNGSDAGHPIGLGTAKVGLIDPTTLTLTATIDDAGVGASNLSVKYEIVSPTSASWTTYFEPLEQTIDHYTTGESTIKIKAKKSTGDLTDHVVQIRLTANGNGDLKKEYFIRIVQPLGTVNSIAIPVKVVNDSTTTTDVSVSTSVPKSDVKFEWDIVGSSMYTSYLSFDGVSSGYGVNLVKVNYNFAGPPVYTKFILSELALEVTVTDYFDVEKTAKMSPKTPGSDATFTVTN